MAPPDARDGPLVLLVEDNPGDARLIERALRSGMGSAFPTPDLVHVESLETAVDRLVATAVDLVLLDLGLEGSSGLATLDRMLDGVEDRGLEPVPVVILTGLEDDVTAFEAVQRGAQDYLVKGTLDGNVLERAIRHAVHRHRQSQELKRQNERLERFARVVSHDLRNPLSVASGHFDLVREECDHESAPVVRDALDRMDAIIESVLAIARGGRPVEETEIVDLGALAEDCWRTVETGDADLVVETDRAVEAEEARLRQVFENLFRNSVEHADPGAAVRVGAAPDGFYVEDDGPGIPPADRDDVFEAGFTTNDEGTGFGLHIVEEIATAHGWQVEVDEATSGGARFEFAGARTAAPGDRPVG